MKIKNLDEIVAQLSRELQRVEDVDIDARMDMEELHRRAANLQPGNQTEVDWLQTKVKQIESQFAAEHPTIARIARELADALAKMGI